MRCVVTWGIIQDARDRTQVGKANNALQMRYCSGANTLKKKKKFSLETKNSALQRDV